jgi:hypothetical protein
MAWLASKAAGSQRDYRADEFKDQPRELKRDAWPKALADAFECVFAQHRFSCY